ncbi:unnamed protein product [Spirodela intermedia]|uniref:Uncharacterized protein n=1 Tax=Spirodela intermedia TaxID=51605 RepID=A0A7I8J986_SPIIN|nr:unnamed protein product [Spirodela intermedia]CAA6666786.1 unnamed protein product [Spirodela intermedia]
MANGSWARRREQPGDFVRTFVAVVVLLQLSLHAAAELQAPAAKEPPSATVEVEEGKRSHHHRHAYAAMIYMGTPRDYEFYVATRVMLRSLAKLNAAADLLVIASADVPTAWQRALKEEDGVKVVVVENLRNPYEQQRNFNQRFRLTLNKLYAWSLVEYERVVMLDADNIFLQSTDELFGCGEFCAVFINPCIFHTGLFVLKPSAEVFKDMLHELETGRRNRDGADQGFLVSYFPDLLDRTMFHPPGNGSKLEGTYRLPMGYQMDASYYYLKLRWRVPCGPNSVITFPSAPLLKPWYWWSWPVLPLGLLWHEQRRSSLGHPVHSDHGHHQARTGESVEAVLQPAAGEMLRLSPCCHQRSGRLVPPGGLHGALAAHPRTVHPLVGWPLYLLGSSTLASVAAGAFLLPPLAVLTPWMAIAGSLAVMAWPWYSDGIVRALAVFGYAFCCAPFLWVSATKVMGSLRRDASQLPESVKLC